jgi:H+/Cl- antiporter ClcA
MSVLVGIMTGSASALFLWLLNEVTGLRETHIWMVALLPAGGWFIGWTYYKYGSSVVRGNNQIIDEYRSPRKIIPLRMAPMILIGTLLTHLFGGSAGREGTAVQMGGALADQVTGWLGLSTEDRRILLLAGVSGGFASVFGTP